MFWNTLVEHSNYRLETVIIPGAPHITNKTIDHLQKQAILPMLPNLKGKTIIDVGCGIGRWTALFAQKAQQIVAIDISKAMIKIAKQNVKDTNVNFIIASAESIPIRSSSMDLIFSCTCLQHLINEEKQKTSIKELSRVTRNKIILLELMSNKKKIILDHYPTSILPESEYKTVLQQAGIRVIRTTGVDFLPFVQLLEHFRNFLLSSFGVNVPTFGGSFKQQLLRYTYQMISAFALFFSLPFYKMLPTPSSNLTRHTLLIAQK